MANIKPVGARELRQNLSRYLRRVAAGETFRVSSRGKFVAILAPLPEHATHLERLIAEGRVDPARMDLAKLGPPPGRPKEISISKALKEQREE